MEQQTNSIFKHSWDINQDEITSYYKSFITIIFHYDFGRSPITFATTSGVVSST